MKTNIHILILLALTTSASIVNAAKPTPNTVNPKRVSKNIGLHPAVPSSLRIVPKAPIKPATSGMTRGMGRTGTGPATGSPAGVGKPKANLFNGSLGKLPGLSPAGNGIRGNADTRLGGIKTGPKGQAFQAGQDIKQMEDLRNSFPGFGRNPGFSGNRPASPGAPDISLGEGGFKGREVNNPLDRNSGNGSGLTDIRGSASNSRKGTETGRSHLSVRGQSLLGAYSPNGASTRYGSTHTQTGESEHVGFSSNGTSSTTVTENRDTRGRLSGTTLETGNVGSRSTDYKTVHFDSHGRAQDVVVNRENHRTGEQTKDVYGPGGNLQSHTSSNDVPTPRDTTPSDGNGSKGNQACGVGVDEIAMGGPAGPHVGDEAGLKPIDLLRQTAEGQQSSGGTNTMTSGRIIGRQVRPDQNSNNGTIHNRLSVNKFGTITNPPPVGGEGAAGGGNSPD